MGCPLANVLILSAGRRVELVEAFRRHLGELDPGARILAADMSPLAAAGFRADAMSLVPPVAHEGWADAIVALCSAESVGLIVPTIDTELAALSTLRDELKRAGTHVLVSGPQTVSIAADKAATNLFLRDHGLPCVRQWSNRSEAEQHNGPLWIKPRFGSASRGVQRCTAGHQLAPLDDPSEPVVYEEEAAGDEVTLDVWVDHKGQVRETVPRRRLEVRAGEVSKGVTERHRAAMDVGGAVAAALPDAYGPVTVQLFVDGDDVTSVIEINPRFGGGYPLAEAAGAHLVRWAIQDGLGLPNRPSAFDWQADIVMLRYDAAVFTNRAALESFELRVR